MVEVRVIFLLIAMFISGCARSPDEGREENAMSSNDVEKVGTYVEFKSELGNKLICPSTWEMEDDGEVFRVSVPNGQAVINVHTYSIKGSGTLAEFQELMVSSIDGDWESSAWAPIKIGDVKAQKRSLVSKDPNAESAWRMYVMQQGDCYHAILLSAWTDILALNGDFYENVIKTFKGISGLP